VAGSKRNKALRAAVGHLLDAWDAVAAADDAERGVEEFWRAASRPGAPFAQVAAEVEAVRRVLAAQRVGVKPAVVDLGIED
jgi:hypothetical protein